jgi:hypothetical protein
MPENYVNMASENVTENVTDESEKALHEVTKKTEACCVSN